MSLKTRISDDMKAAMRSKETQKLSAIRMLIAAVKQKEIDEQIELDDAQALAVIEKQIKQRRDSIEQYDKAGRDDLAKVERFELDVLSAYLPAQASDEEIAAAIEAAIAKTGATGMRDMGKVMGILKTELAGQADMGAMSGRVKTVLATKASAE
ncbi:MAG: GatB/YqeY domain-containing protein [Burkholderiaceae bacterium]